MITKIIIPELNLINKSNNKDLYYNRLADEFIRYNKFKQFIFESDSVIFMEVLNLN